MSSTTEVLVVGGGPAGMAAALSALAAGARVTLLERNEKLGKKLYITGKGRCNVTNLCGRDAFLEQVPRNPRFLNAALDFLSPADLVDWLKRLGCPTVAERGNRVFPESQKASDVTRALSGGLAGADVRLGAGVSSLMTEQGSARGARLDSGAEIRARAVVVATGGLSYPLTGSTGDGYRFAEQAGHEVTPRSPSLTGLVTSDAWMREAQGLTLENVALSATWPGKGRYREQGELLFTHYGISGPLALTLSSLLSGTDAGQAQAFIDLKPALDAATLKARFQKDAAENGRRRLAGALTAYLPSSLAALFPGIAGVDGMTVMSQVSAPQRDALLGLMKRLPVHITGLRPFSEAVVTRGGVSVRQVSPSTMSSRLIRGLYFAGEVLDVDAMTGGFNLHIAFATGALAGHAAALYALENN